LPELQVLGTGGKHLLHLLWKCCRIPAAPAFNVFVVDGRFDRRSSCGQLLSAALTERERYKTRNFSHIQERAPFDSLSERFWLNLQARYDLEMPSFRTRECSDEQQSFVSSYQSVICDPTAPNKPN
jgi:hypothetical protein